MRVEDHWTWAAAGVRSEYTGGTQSSTRNQSTCRVRKTSPAVGQPEWSVPIRPGLKDAEGGTTQLSTGEPHKPFFQEGDPSCRDKVQKG